MARTPDHGNDHGEPPRLTDEDLQEINRWWTVCRIVTNASHDLNNALQIISGNTEMMRAKGHLDPTLARRADSIAAQADRAAAIVDRLASYVRDTAAVPQRIDLHALATKALALRSVTLSRARLATLLVSSDDQPYWVDIDPQEGLQLLLNLLLRAEQDLAGQTAAGIEVRLSRAAGSIELAVEEKGEKAASWTPQTGAQMRLEFAMADRVVSRLAERCGGRLAVDGEPDGGRRVILSVPSSE